MGQDSLFEMGGGAEAVHQDLPVPALPDERSQVNEWEKETLGLFLSSHPLKEVRHALRAKVDCSLAEIGDKKDGDWVTVGGMIAECKRIRTRKGDPMMFATLDDLEGQIELLVFSSAYEDNAGEVDVDKIVIVRGRVDKKEEGEVKVVAQDVQPFDPTPEEVLKAEEDAAREPEVKRLTLHVSPGVPASFLDDLREAVRHHPGDHELVLAVGERRLKLGPDFAVSGSPPCKVELGGLQGAARLAA
jgi:DNA polymerase-3 subunit alpha